MLYISSPYSLLWALNLRNLNLRIACHWRSISWFYYLYLITAEQLIKINKMLAAAHHSLHTSSFSEERFITFLGHLFWSESKRLPSSILLTEYLETSTSLNFYLRYNYPSGEIHDVLELSCAENCRGSKARRRVENERPIAGWRWRRMTVVSYYRSSHCWNEADEEFQNVWRHFSVCF